MGQCVSLRLRRTSAASHDRGSQQQQDCHLERLPPQVFSSILMLLEQQELMQTAPLVCKAWHQAANQAVERLVLDLSHVALPNICSWLQQHRRQLKLLHLSTSTPLGRVSKKGLLRSLAGSEHCQPGSPVSTINSITNSSSWDPSSWGSSEGKTAGISDESSPGHLAATAAAAAGPVQPHRRRLQLHQLALQMDLDVGDLLFLAQHVVRAAPQLHTLKLQPLKPSLADLQLLVLACIVGNLVGADAPGPVLPHLNGCGAAVASVVSMAPPSLRSLSLSRYDVGSVACVTSAQQLTSLVLQHCSLTDSCLGGLASLSRLQRLELPDNYLTPASLREVAKLRHLTHLDLSVMPARGRMRSARGADISPLTALHRLRRLNLIGFGVADIAPLRGLALHTLEVGLNPLSSASLAAMASLSPSLRHLELGGVSQAWMIASDLPPDLTSQAHAISWVNLSGLQHLTALDLGGSHFSSVVWVCHMCPLLIGMRDLQRLMLAHCSIPAGKMQYLLPGLSSQLVELNIDRCPVSGDELLGLAHLTRLTKLSACAMVPELDNKQAALLANTLHSPQHLVLRSNAIGGRGAHALASLTTLTSLDLTNCPIGRRATKQLAHLLTPHDSHVSGLDMEARCW